MPLCLSGARQAQRHRTSGSIIAAHSSRRRDQRPIRGPGAPSSETARVGRHSGAFCARPRQGAPERHPEPGQQLDLALRGNLPLPPRPIWRRAVSPRTWV